MIYGFFILNFLWFFHEFIRSLLTGMAYLNKLAQANFVYFATVFQYTLFELMWFNNGLVVLKRLERIMMPIGDDMD